MNINTLKEMNLTPKQVGWLLDKIPTTISAGWEMQGDGLYVESEELGIQLAYVYKDHGYRVSTWEVEG